MDLINKNFSFEIKKQSEDEDFFRFSGYASTFGNIDQTNDIIDSGAFTKSLAERTPKLLYQHNYDQCIGVIDKIIEDSKGLFIEARLPKANTLSNNTGILLKCGALDSMSIGFQSMLSEYDEEKEVRYIKIADLWEISIVTFPANRQAMVTNVKNVTSFKEYPIAPKNTKWDVTQAIKDIKKHTNSENIPSATYENGFMLCDSSKKEDFASYKLPYLAEHKGKLHIIPNAILSTHNSMVTVKDGITTVESGNDELKARVNKYYKLLGMETPFEDSKNFYFYRDISEISTKKDFERLLRDSGAFSKKSAVFLASRFKEIDRSDSEQKNTVDGVEKKKINDLIGDLKNVINLFGDKHDEFRRSRKSSS